jgi:hypothetical protein
VGGPLEVDFETVLVEMGLKARRWMYQAHDPALFATSLTCDVDSLGSVVSICFRRFRNDDCHVSCASVRQFLLAELRRY